LFSLSGNLNVFAPLAESAAVNDQDEILNEEGDVCRSIMVLCVYSELKERFAKQKWKKGLKRQG